MKINIDDYKLSKEFVQKWYREQGRGDLKNSVAILASTTMVPCVVIAYWLGEITEWDPIILESIDNLTKFYGYTQINGVPDGFPKRS